MKNPSVAALERAKRIILGRDSEYMWHSENIEPPSLFGTNAVYLGGTPADGSDSSYHTLVIRFAPDDEKGKDIGRALSVLIYDYAEKNGPENCAFGGGTNADGMLWKRYTIPDDFLGGLRESLANGRSHTM